MRVYDKKLQYRTYVYIKRYTNLKKVCQICGEEAEIVCSNEELKINLLCSKHKNCKNRVNKIDLRDCTTKQPPLKMKQNEINKKMNGIKNDISKGRTFAEISRKYNLAQGTIYKRISKSDEMLNCIVENGKKVQREIHCKNQKNIMQKYRLENNMTAREFSKLTGIPIATIRAIETGVHEVGNKTRQKLERANIYLV